MELSFRSKKIQKLCCSAKEMQKKLAPQEASRLKQRLAELAAADSLNDIQRVPPARCHELSQNRDGQLAVDINNSKRFIFEPNHEPIPLNAGNGLDWSRVTSILIIEVEDYH